MTKRDSFSLISNKIGMIQPNIYFKLLFTIVLFINFLLLTIPRSDNHLLSSDAGYYYSYLRSIVLDFDLNLVNDIDFYNSRMNINNPARLEAESARMFSIGPSLLWAPSFILGHGLNLTLNYLGFSISKDGYSYIEEGFVSIASVLYALLGLFLIYKTLLIIYPKSNPLFVTIILFLSTSIFYYVIFEPTMSHTLEFFTVSFFIWTLLNLENENKKKWLIVGLSSGIMIIVRWQNSLFLLLLIYILLNYWYNIRNPVKTITRTISLFMLSFLPILSIQFIIWEILFDSFLSIPQGSEFLSFFKPYFFEVLFSSRHGLFSWTPVTLLSLVGLFFFERRGLALMFLLIIVLEVYVCSITSDWWGGSSFGQRRLIGLIPIMCIGFASLAHHIKNMKFRRSIYFLSILFVFWNFAFIIQYRLGFIETNNYLTFKEMVIDKFNLPFAIVNKLTNK